MSTSTVYRKAYLRPGWPELAIGLATYLAVLSIAVTWMLQIPDEQAGFRGNIGMAGNGIARIAGLLAAFALRIRNFAAFGFRRVRLRWLLIALGLGIFAFGASFPIEWTYFHFIDEPNTQGDFQAGAKEGALALAVLLVTGALLTPLGEEFVFRGIVANALNRYGVWAGVVASALIFAAAHGPSVIFVLAFGIGLLTGALFRLTGSIWPAIVLHVTYNGLHLFGYSTL